MLLVNKLNILELSTAFCYYISERMSLASVRRGHYYYGLALKSEVFVLANSYQYVNKARLAARYAANFNIPIQEQQRGRIA
jgi:hypothetical protein